MGYLWDYFLALRNDFLESCHRFPENQQRLEELI